MKRLAVISGSRADYNMMLFVAESISQVKKFQVHFWAVNINNQARYETGFGVNEISLNMKASVPAEIFKAMDAIATRTYVKLKDEKIDYVVVLGDRWDIVAVTQAAIMAGVGVIHLGGGETTRGSYDDIFRDWISRAACIHFVVHDEAKNILQDKYGYKNVYTVGSPRMDYMSRVMYYERTTLWKMLGLKPDKKTALVLMHPETSGKGCEAKELAAALKDMKLQSVIIRPGKDRGADQVVRDLEKVGVVRNDVALDEWAGLMRGVDVMIGNSSAGLMETPSYKLPTVNIGDRQEGRWRPANVISCPCSRTAIKAAVTRALRDSFRTMIAPIRNTLADGQCGKRIARVLEEIL